MKKSYSKEFQEAIIEIIETDYFNKSQKVKEFEKEFDAYCDEMASRVEDLGKAFTGNTDHAETVKLVDAFFLG